MSEKNCPICGEEKVASCRCPRCDSACKNGHSWHTCVVHGVTVIGKSDHALPTWTCTCGRGDEGENKTGVRKREI
jgi:hypothetical protein